MKKMKREQIIFDTRLDKPPCWKDIKNLKLEDDDKIITQWISQDQFGGKTESGYWYVTIYRVGEETIEQGVERLELFHKLEKEL